MGNTPTLARRLRWIVAAGLFTLLFALPGRVFAAVIYADLDHDGIRDVITVQTSPEPGLKVWLSHSNSTTVLPTKQQILAIAALDLRGDGQVQLVASDTRARVHVWHQSANGGLRRTRPKRQAPAAALSRGTRLHASPDQTPGAVISSAGTPVDGTSAGATAADDAARAPMPHAGGAIDSVDSAPPQPRGPPLA